jgi:hypothetical protein
MFELFCLIIFFSVDPISSSKVSTPSKEITSTLRRLEKSKMPAVIPGDGSLNLSLKQVRKATQNFSPLLKLGEGGIWAVYRAILSDNQIVIIRRAKKVDPNSLIFSPCVLSYQLVFNIIYHGVVIDQPN